MSERLQLVPITISDAKEFVRQHHRHHRPPTSGLFAVAAGLGDVVVGVAIVGRPIALGYRRLLTYTLPSEGGASLRAAGWTLVGRAGKIGGGGWNCESRPRVDLHPTQEKFRWERTA